MRFIIVLSLLCNSVLFAQVPGFQGKRFSVEGSFMFNSALSNPNENFNKGLTAFNKRFQAGAEYIIGRNLSIGTSYGIFNSGFESEVYNSRTNLYDTEDRYNLKSNVAGLYFKIFKFRKKGAIAPYGAYGKIGLLEVIVNGVFMSRNNPSNLNTPETINQTTHTLLNYGFGKQFIIRDKFIARVGFDLGLTVFSASDRASLNISILTKRRVSSGMLFNLEAGVGILIF